MGEALEGLMGFGRVAFLTGALVAGVCALLSVQVVLNRIVFVSAALGQVAAMGIALGLLKELGHGEVLAVSVVATAAAVAFLAARLERGALPLETRLGVVYVTGSATSILLVSKSAAGKEEVVHLLEGSLLFAEWREVWMLSAVLTIVGLALLASFRHLVLVGFDPEGARAMGYRVERWRLLLFALVGLAVATCMHSAGLLLTFAYLVLPGSVALHWTASLPGATALAVGVAVTAHAAGLLASFHPTWDLPPGPVVVVMLFLAYALGRAARRR